MSLQPIRLQNSQYTEISRYNDAVVALGDLGISVHIYFSDTDVLVLALCRFPELSAESATLMGTGAK